jgi:hypothetical protein
MDRFGRNSHSRCVTWQVCCMPSEVWVTKTKKIWLRGSDGRRHIVQSWISVGGTTLEMTETCMCMFVNFYWRNLHPSTVRGSNCGRGEISRTRPDLPWGPPSFLYAMNTGSFSGVKRPRLGVDHEPASGAEVKERVELYFSSHLCFHGQLKREI